MKMGLRRFSIVSQLAGESEVRYGLMDEERRININKASYSVLKSLFETVAQTTSEQAGSIADSIIDWRDEDDEPGQNGAESGYYLTLEPAYPCKNKPFEALEELLLVKGVSEEIYNKVKDKITIYGTGAVNINTAEETVLQSLGMSQPLAEKIIHFRKGSDGKEATADDNVFENVSTIGELLSSGEGLSSEEMWQLNNILSAGLLSVRSDNFRGESIGELTDKAGSVKILFIFNRNKVIKYWREK